MQRRINKKLYKQQRIVAHKQKTKRNNTNVLIQSIS